MKIKSPNKSGKRTILKCLNCGEEFQALDTKIRAGREKFCCNDCYKEFRKKNKVNSNEKNILYQKKHRYKLTEEEYKNLFINQENKCLICGIEFNDNSKSQKAHVDHDHNTLKVRGLLCSKCNSILGFCNDDIKVLENAIKYLNKHKN